MSFITPVSPRWYGRLNEATFVASLLIVLGYISLEFLFTGAAQVLPLQFSLPVVAVSGVGLIYGSIGYRLLAKKLSAVAGLLSYVLLAAVIGGLVLTTGGVDSQFLLLWAVVIVFSGMFGWATLLITWLVTHGYFFLLTTGVLGQDVDTGTAVMYMIALELPFLVSFFLWYGQSVNTDGAIAELPGDVGAGDIKQNMLINSIAEGVVVIDEQKQIQVFNPAAVDISGWPAEEAKGLDYHTVLNLTDTKGNQLLSDQDPISRVFKKAETVVDNEVVLHTRNNKELELTFVGSPITNKNGGVVAVVGVFRDVSEERNQERQRAEFISTASHEMRTPVAAIEGYLALAMNDNVAKIDSKAKSYLEKAHASTQHLGKLFQDLLTAAKSEDGRLKNHPEVVEMGAFVDQLVEDIRFTAEKKGLLLEYDGHVDANIAGAQSIRPLYYTYIDPERMREVVINLFDNAVKYTEEGKITVKLTGDEKVVQIVVADTGPGIPQEDIPHLFQKFYRVDNTATRQIGGTGLGLFISRKIVDMNGGKIWVESTVDQGSQFYINLPRIDQAKAEQLKKTSTSDQTPLANVATTTDL
jgi:PAS domain S-box-containing protein